MAENVDQDNTKNLIHLEHVRGFTCGCRCFDDGPSCRQFMGEKIADSPTNV